jgi:hypothetical protein
VSTSQIGHPSDYASFVRGKRLSGSKRGLASLPKLATHLFRHQGACVEFGLSLGSWGLFTDTGMGKTACELEWSRHAGEASNGRALILTPLAVARQIEREAKRWGYEARVIREQSEVRLGINICNYDRLVKLDCDAFGAVALDESSILKSFGGKTCQELISAFAGHRWRMAATATPAPNDHMELGQHSAFLGQLQANEMLSRWFINDTSEASQSWRLKGYACHDFWDWMSSWCRMAECPADLGDDETAYKLPDLKIVRHRCESEEPLGYGLFGSMAVSATEIHDVKRATAAARAEAISTLVCGSDEPWLVWCDTNYEADEIMRLLGKDAVEVRGSDTTEEKEARLYAFVDKSARVLVTKPSIAGHGLNFQHCARVAFVGRTFSYESWYQAVRRCWRYGQTREVEVHLIVADGEDAIGRVLARKGDDHARMKAEMVEAMRRNVRQEQRGMVAYAPSYRGGLPRWL